MAKAIIDIFKIIYIKIEYTKRFIILDPMVNIVLQEKAIGEIG